MAEIIINSLGEAIKRKSGKQSDAEHFNAVEPLGVDSVNINVVANQVLTPEQFAEWATFCGDEADALHRYVSAKCQEAFLVAAWNDMSLPVFDFYKRVTDLQVLNDGRFRVWGRKTGLTFKAMEYIWLVTELANFVAEEAFWKELRAAAKQRYSLVTLIEHPYEDKKHQVGVNGVLPDFSNANDDNAIYGEDHGQMERQVEFRINIAELSKQRHAFSLLREEIDKMRNITEPFWEQHGVAVG